MARNRGYFLFVTLLRDLYENDAHGQTRSDTNGPRCLSHPGVLQHVTRLRHARVSHMKWYNSVFIVWFSMPRYRNRRRDRQREAPRADHTAQSIEPRSNRRSRTKSPRERLRVSSSHTHERRNKDSLYQPRQGGCVPARYEEKASLETSLPSVESVSMCSNPYYSNARYAKERSRTSILQRIKRPKYTVDNGGSVSPGSGRVSGKIDQSGPNDYAADNRKSAIPRRSTQTINRSKNGNSDKHRQHLHNTKNRHGASRVDACHAPTKTHVFQKSLREQERDAVVQGHIPRRIKRQIPKDFSGSDLEIAIVALEMKRQESFVECARRLHIGQQNGDRTPSTSGIMGDDILPSSRLACDIDANQTRAVEWDIKQQKRIKRRCTDIENQFTAKAHGGTHNALYARKVDRHGNSLPVVCMKWVEGLCVYGDECPELHTYDPSFIPACSFFHKNGFCTKYDCPYKHIETEHHFFHCKTHLLGGVCSLGEECTDLHVTCKRGSVPADSLGLTPQSQLVKPHELCLITDKPELFSKRQVEPGTFVKQNELTYSQAPGLRSKHVEPL